MNCKTTCGAATTGDRILCDSCNGLWNNSAERARCALVPIGPRRAVAIVDFCDRVRAERNNKPKPEVA